MLLCTLAATIAAAAPSRPNIIYFLTDDQDQMLGGSFPQVGGVGPMGETKRLLQDEGSMAERFYVHTPICNPSRASLLTGRYFHNIKTSGAGTWYGIYKNLIYMYHVFSFETSRPSHI
jgi:arylsulfatase A-like enzyme